MQSGKFYVEEDTEYGTASAGPFDTYAEAMRKLLEYERDLRIERKFNVDTGEDDLVWFTSPIVNGWFEYRPRHKPRAMARAVRIVES